MSFWKSGKKGDEESAQTPAMETIRGALAATGGKSTPAPQESSRVTTPSVPSGATEVPGDLSGDKYGKIRSALGPGTVIQGKLSFDTPVRIDGKLSGEIYSTKALVVGETGDIQADVQVSTLVILGKVRGTVKATEKIEILKSGELIGDVVTGAISIEEGARFSGSCSMGKGKVVAVPVAAEKGERSKMGVANGAPHSHSK